jgi:hypothetical protein
MEEDATFGREKFRMQKSNIVQLAYAFYSDFSYKSEREELLFRILSLPSINYQQYVPFYNHLLQAIAE